MLPLSLPRHTDSARPSSPVDAIVRLALFCWVLGALCGASSAQNIKGLPAVGNGTATQSSSQMLIDATQFGTGTDDMCAKIADACVALGSAANYPLGATIDARGFTGNQVCAASTITKMLFKCVPQGSSTGATSGKLLLGEVNLYADGPTGGVNGNYTDGTSGIGTPALIIPSFFWGIEGVSRGASAGNGTAHPPAGQGTFLSVCTGNGTPVNASNAATGSPICHNSFPVRSFTVNSATVVGNVMSMNVSPALNWGVNIYPGELVMMKGNNTLAPAENGTYRVQNNSPDTTINVTVPTGTPSCTPPSGICATLYLGTPILGFANTNNPYNSPTCFTTLCSGFGQHIKNLGFNCQGGGTQPSGDIEGCIGWQNLYAQEETGADTFLVTNFNFVGVDIHGGPKNGTQNFGPVLNGEIYTGANNVNCDYGTTGIYIGDAEMRGFNGWTINQSSESPNPSAFCTNKPIAAVLFDAPATEVRNGHCEGFTNCILIGANNGNASGAQVSGVGGGPTGNAGTNIVQISANFASSNGKYVIERIRKNFHSNAVMDNINNVTLSDPFLALYSYAGIRAGAVATGVSTNTDLAGQCTVGGAQSCTNIPLTQTYNSKPICTCSDTNSTVAACNVEVTLGSPSTLTVLGTNGHLLDYICIGRN